MSTTTTADPAIDESDSDETIDDEADSECADTEEEGTSDVASSATDDTETAPDPETALAFKEAQAALLAPTTLERQTQPGIIRGLAASLALKASTLLVITKTSSDALLVTIQPGLAENETAASAIPLQVTGTAAEIDATLIEALAHYVPARSIAIESAQAIANATAQAAAHAKSEAAKRKTTTTTPGKKPVPATKPAVPTEFALTIITKPSSAMLTVTNSAKVNVPMLPGKSASLPAGTYTIVASAPGHHEATQTLELTKAQSLAIVLKEEQLTLLG